MYTFHILTIGHLSRNRYWGERDSIAYRRALATCTLISGSGQQILVDPSLPEGDMPEALLNACGLHLEDITQVFTTHYHYDHHVSPLAFPNAKWIMPEKELRYLEENWAEYNRVFPADKFETLAHCSPAPQFLAPGIEVVPLPGHTEGLCGLRFDAPEGRILLTGDAIMNREFYQAGEPYLFGWNDDIGRATIASAAGTADVIIPGHGEAFLEAPWRKKA